MQCSKVIISNQLLKFLTLVLLFCGLPLAQAQKVGFEKEFATIGYIEPVWGPKQLQTSEEILQIVKENYGGYGTIQSRQWEKYPHKKIEYKYYIDPKGRTWKVDPEAVNSTGLDGLEFVTPPLEDKEDLEKAQKILSDIKRKKIVMRGIRSSGHVTVDVSHLLTDPRNVSELVDLILTIENHWSEIYEFFRPKRYGTIVNRFSIPLAADQQQLLQELASLPHNKRTYVNVRNLFFKYDRIEGQLRDPDGSNPGKKWKYRAANYGKLFGLTSPEKTPVIEFRIPDLDFGAELKNQAEFLRNLVNLKTLDQDFKYPFGQRPVDWQEATRILKTKKTEQPFLASLIPTGINLDQLLEANPKATSSEIKLADIYRPQGVAGEFFSFGFEAEFRGSNEKKVFDKQGIPNIKKFPYLDTETDVEGTGNKEIRSLGGEISLGEVIEQMTEIREVLGSDMRGFHLHMRIPHAVVYKHNQDTLNAWMSLISDSVFAWRLQNRRHFFALRTGTLARQGVDRIESRGPIRLTMLPGGVWDFEIRGYMTDVEQIALLAQKMITGLLNPELIKQNIDERKYLTHKHQSIQDAFNEYLRLYKGRSLTPDEASTLTLISREVEGEGLIPLYRLDLMSVNDQFEKQKIRDATLEFYKETMTVVGNYLSNKQVIEEAERQFRWRIKRWALKIDLQSILESKILNSNSVYDKSSKFTLLELADLLKQINSRNSDTKVKGYGRLEDIDHIRIIDLIERGLSEPDEKLKKMAASALLAQTSPQAFRLVKKALSSRNEDVQGYAIQALKNHPNEEGFKLLKKILDGNNNDLKVKAITQLQYFMYPEVYDYLNLFLNSANDSIRYAAIQVLPKYKGVGKNELIEKSIKSKKEDVKFAGYEALKNYDGLKGAEIIKEGLNDPDLRIRVEAAEHIANLPDLKIEQIMKFISTKENKDVLHTLPKILEAYSLDERINLAKLIIANPDIDHWVNHYTILSLLGSSDPKVIPIVQAVMLQNNNELKQLAIRALAHIETPETYLILQDAFKHKNISVRSIAYEVLGTFGSERAEKLLRSTRSKAQEADQFYIDKALRDLRRNTILNTGSTHPKYKVLRCDKMFLK